MINVDKRNGDIYIDEVRFNRFSSIMDVNKLNEKYTLKSYGVPDGWLYYVINDYDDGETTISFAFCKGKFTFLEIYEGSNYNFPRFAMTEEQKRIVKKKLLLLGGEQKYTWGGIRYSEDGKTGLVSVMISFNDNQVNYN